MNRKDEARRRLEILDEDFEGQVRGILGKHYRRDDIRAGISRHVTSERNLLGRVVDEIAAPLYATPPTRSIADATDELDERLAKLVEVLELDTFMQEAVGVAFACNVVHIVPVMQPDPADPEALIPALELVTPDVSDVDLRGRTLTRLTYDLDTEDDDPRRRVAVDARGWHYLDGDGELVEDVTVELGRCPAIEFRLRPWRRGDYWGGRRGRKLVDATLQIARIAAHMGWVRETQNAKYLALICHEQALASQGKIDPRRPGHLNADKTEADALVLDLEVKVDAFMAEIRSHAEPVLESYGLPYAAFDLELGAVTPAGAVQLHGLRNKIRRQQLPQAKRAERALMHRVCEVLTAYDHPLAIDPQIILDRYQVEWSELTFVAHPLELIEIQDKKMAHGFLGPVDAMREWYPDLTRKQCAARQEGNFAERAQVLQTMARHNMPKDPANDGNYVAQLQGQVGQLQRDLDQQPTEDDDK